MAYTVSRINSVFGNQRIVHLDVTADAATQAIDTGLAIIKAISTAKLSMNSANQKININVNASGVAANGYVAVTGFTSGDHFFITVYGS